MSEDPGVGYGLFGPVIASFYQPDPTWFSIAVMPFTVLGANPDDQYFADGITDDLITSLSQIAGTFVIGRSTMFTYRGRNVDPREVGRDLNVRHVVAGSIRCGPDYFQLNVELVDPATGAQDWAEKIEHRALEWQTASGIVASRIARALNLELMKVGSRGAGLFAGQLPQAAEVAMRGWVELFNKPQTQETNDTAERWLSEAIAADSSLALAWTGLAYVNYRGATFGWINDSMHDGLRRAVEYAQRAIGIDAGTADAHYVMGQSMNGLDDLENAQAAHQTCIELNASHAPAYAALGQVRMFLGYPEETAAFCARAFALSPHEPLRAIWLRSRGLAALFLGDALAASDDAYAAININPSYASAYVLLAAAQVRLGRPTVAAEALAKLPAISGYRTLGDVKHALARPRHERYSKFLEEMLNNLRDAGLPA